MLKTYTEFKNLFPDSTKFYCSYTPNTNYKNNEIIITCNKNKYIHELLIEYPSHQYACIDLDPKAQYVIYTNKKFGMIYDMMPIFAIIDVDDKMMQEIISIEIDKILKEVKNNDFNTWKRNLIVSKNGFDKFDSCYFAQLLNEPKIKTFDLCKNIVVLYFFLIKYVPSEFLNDDFFEYCCNNMCNANYYYMLAVFIRFRSKEITLPICYAIVYDVYSYYNFQDNLFSFIPISFLTDEFLLDAIEKANKKKSEDDFLKFTSKLTKYLTEKKLFTDKIKLHIDKFNRNKIIKEKTQEEYFGEIKKNPYYFYSIPKKIITIEMCNYVLSSGEFTNFEKFPNDILELNEDVILSCIKKFRYHDTSSYLENIPNHLRTYKVCKLCIEYNVFNLRYVPILLKNKELCDFAYYKAKSCEKNRLYEIFPHDVQIQYDNMPKSSGCTIS
jgi:hypothetical protein